MTKKSAKKTVAPEQTSLFRMAGEAIGTIGHEIVEGKDKLVEVSQAAVEKLSSVRKAISKKISKKKIKTVTKKKIAPFKKAAKKIVKKVAKKVTKKIAKKTKKAAPKNTAKKSVIKRKK